MQASLYEFNFIFISLGTVKQLSIDRGL